MIKIYVRAIVPTENAYVLMGEPDKNGEQTWDLPGGELQPGVDVRQLLQKLVMQNTGYPITNISFFEITCKVKPRTRAQGPITILEFIFTSKIDPATEKQKGEKEIDLLQFGQFEWLESGGRFHLNKVMNLLSRYHHKYATAQDSRLSVDTED